MRIDVPLHMESRAVELLSRITQTPGLCGGRPCIRGLRIRVTDILEMLALGVTETEILRDFPLLVLDDIRACLLYGSRLAAHMQVAA